MTTRKKKVIELQYKIGNNPLDRVYVIKDLRVYFISNLKFNIHCDAIFDVFD